MNRLLSEVRKFVAPEFVVGKGALDLLGRYARNLGAKKVLLVTDPGVRDAGWAQRALASLERAGVPCAVHDGVSANPRDHEVMAGLGIYRRERCDVIVAVGGGSPMDCAKGIAVCAANPGDVLDFEGVDEVPSPGPPLICLPTTAGTAADISQFAIVTDWARRVKIAIISKSVVPDCSLIDPETTLTMGAELTAATGMDALTHAVEAYVSNASSPVTDLHAIEAVRLVRENLAKAVRDGQDHEARTGMALASTHAGLAFSNASLGLVHAMAHSLGGRLDLPHGVCNALLLEHVVEANWSGAGERYRRIGEALGLRVGGGLEQARRELRAGLKGLRESIGLVEGLGARGVGESQLEPLSRTTVQDPCLATNPVVFDQPGVLRVFERALAE